MNVKFDELRAQYPRFTYQSSKWEITENEMIMRWHFHLNSEIHFYPESRMIFNSNVNAANFADQNYLDSLVAHIGLIELVSYWKASCSPIIDNKVIRLDEKQELWWKKLYFNGLGEFFYTNAIETNEADFVQFDSCNAVYQPQKYKVPMDHETVIVPIGGGKDSIVSLELLKQSGKKVIPLIINPRGATLDTIQEGGFARSEIIEIKRTLDPTIIKLNQAGFLNGHTPFSAMLAFYCLLGASAVGVPYIALSNENSANESTVPGTNINHQYSKSIEFEKDFRQYCTQTLNEEIQYFSFLRPLSELQIVALFSQLTNYHSLFRSCNVGSKTDSWCGQCPKCLFAAIMLGAFLPANKIKSIFGHDLMNDKNLIPILEELTGVRPVKPFECVGTVNEVRSSMSFIAANNTQKSLLSDHFLSTLPSTLSDFETQLHEWDANHFLPYSFEKILKHALETFQIARKTQQ